MIQHDPWSFVCRCGWRVAEMEAMKHIGGSLWSRKIADALTRAHLQGHEAEAECDEETMSHPSVSRTPYETGDDRDIWCKDCKYHRDHAIHNPAPAPAITEAEGNCIIEVHEGNISGARSAMLRVKAGTTVEVSWRHPHGAVHFWQIRDHGDSRGIDQRGDTVDVLEADLKDAQAELDRLRAEIATLKPKDATSRMVTVYAKKDDAHDLVLCIQGVQARAEAAESRADTLQHRLDARDAALAALREKWLDESKKDHDIWLGDDSGGIWAYQHEAAGRATARRQCAADLDALLAGDPS